MNNAVKDNMIATIGFLLLGLCTLLYSTTLQGPGQGCFEVSEGEHSLNDQCGVHYGITLLSTIIMEIGEGQMRIDGFVK